MSRTERAKMLAKILNVPEQDGWYNVDHIATVDGDPWVTEGEFLKIIEMDKYNQIENFIRGQFEGVMDDEWCDVEATTLVLLQDNFDVTEWVANEFIQAFFNEKS